MMFSNKSISSLVGILGLGFVVVAVLITSFKNPSLAIAVEDQTSYLPLISNPKNFPIPTATSTQPPTPTHTPIPSQIPGEDWLSYLNYMRYLGSLPGVTSNNNWSDGCWLHSRYMVKNDEISHSEDPSNPWYTISGEEAASNSNVMVSSIPSSTDMYAIDLWMSGPFHGVSILDPQLETVGFGSYRETIGNWQMGASLDVSRGRTLSEPPAGTYPVMWPGNGQNTNILAYRGTEWPDPLTSCPGITADYWNPSGPPIYLQLGSGDVTPNVSVSSFKQENSNLEHCVFDETNYTNPNNSTQNTGRWILNIRDAIIIIPKHPLEPEKTYTASVTTNGNIYTWSFKAESSSQLLHELPETYMSSR